MPRYFLDSSALVKHYHWETGTDKVEKLWNEPGNRLFISRLALVELHSCFARLVREGVISSEDLRGLIARLEADVASGVLLVAAVSGPRLQEASILLKTLGIRFPIRALDAIHLATAQALHGRAHLAAFVAADKRLLSSASMSGLLALDVG